LKHRNLLPPYLLRESVFIMDRNKYGLPHLLLW